MESGKAAGRGLAAGAQVRLGRMRTEAFRAGRGLAAGAQISGGEEGAALRAADHGGVVLVGVDDAADERDLRAARGDGGCWVRRSMSQGDPCCLGPARGSDSARA